MDGLANSSEMPVLAFIFVRGREGWVARVASMMHRMNEAVMLVNHVTTRGCIKLVVG